MKKIDIILTWVGLLLLILGIVFNQTVLFLIGFIDFTIGQIIDEYIMLKETYTTKGDSDEYENL